MALTCDLCLGQMSNKLYWQITKAAGHGLLEDPTETADNVEICNECHQDLVERRDCGDPTATCGKLPS
jgi:hypothetical protein